MERPLTIEARILQPTVTVVQKQANVDHCNESYGCGVDATGVGRSSCASRRSLTDDDVDRLVAALGRVL